MTKAEGLVWLIQNPMEVLVMYNDKSMQRCLYRWEGTWFECKEIGHDSIWARDLSQWAHAHFEHPEPEFDFKKEWVALSDMGNIAERYGHQAELILKELDRRAK